MAENVCPNCKNALYEYPQYLYCYSCSKQFKVGMLGKLKEVPNTIQSDQQKAMGR